MLLAFNSSTTSTVEPLRCWWRHSRDKTTIWKTNKKAFFFDQTRRPLQAEQSRLFSHLYPRLTARPHSWTEGDFPALHPFSFHYPHFFLVSTQHWNVIEPAQQAIRSVCGGAPLKPSLKLYPYPQLLFNPPPPWLLNESSQGKDSCFASVVQRSLFQCHTVFSFNLDTDQPEVSGTLHKSGMQFLDQLVSAGGWGGAQVGEGEESNLTDIQYTQLMPQTGNLITSCVLVDLSIFIIQYVRREEGGNFTTAANTAMLMSRICEQI